MWLNLTTGLLFLLRLFLEASLKSLPGRNPRRISDLFLVKNFIMKKFRIKCISMWMCLYKWPSRKSYALKRQSDTHFSWYATWVHSINTQISHKEDRRSPRSTTQFNQNVRSFLLKIMPYYPVWLHKTPADVICQRAVVLLRTQQITLHTGQRLSTWVHQ